MAGANYGSRASVAAFSDRLSGVNSIKNCEDYKKVRTARVVTPPPRSPLALAAGGTKRVNTSWPGLKPIPISPELGFRMAATLRGKGGKASSVSRDDYLAPQIIGADPENTERLWEQNGHRNPPLSRRGALIWALSAIDVALWDIKAKAAGVPLALTPRRSPGLRCWPMGRAAITGRIGSTRILRRRWSAT